MNRGSIDSDKVMRLLEKPASAAFSSRFSGKVEAGIACACVLASGHEGSAALVEEEGLLQRGLNLASMCGTEHDAIADYYRVIPCPQAAIILTARPDTLAFRNEHRALFTADKDRSPNRFFYSWMVDIVQVARRGVYLTSGFLQIDALRLYRSTYL